MTLAELLLKHQPFMLGRDIDSDDCRRCVDSPWESDEEDAAHLAEVVTEFVLDELKAFLPEWNYPDYVVGAIRLEMRARLMGEVGPSVPLTMGEDNEHP